MKILFLCKQIPHEKVIGGPIIVYNRIKYLSKRHEVSLMSFLREEKEREFLPTITKFCKESAFPPLKERRPFINSAFQFLFSDIPPYFLTTYVPEFKEKLQNIAPHYDVIIAEYSVMGQYLYKNRRLPKRVKRVISCHECYFTARLTAFKEGFPKIEGIEALLHLKGLKEYEFNMYRDADMVFTLTEEDKIRLLDFAPDINISVIPHGVDTRYFSPFERSKPEPACMFLGNYPHLPNRDAVLYFYNDILPLIRKEIPHIKFYIVGRNPQDDLKAISKNDPDVIVTGTVPDVREYFKMTSVFVCPVKLGGGFRGKMLEALACGIPVVSTSIGAAGMPIRNGEDMLIADGPEDFAFKVLSIFKDKDIKDRLSTQGRKLAEEFTWQRGTEKLEKVLEELIIR